MARHKEKVKLRTVSVSLGLSALMLITGLLTIDAIDAAFVGQRLGMPLLRLLAFISIGLVVGQVIEAAGWTRSLALLAGPLFRFGNLGPRCSAAFTAAFFSGVTANAMLVDFLKDGKINRRQLFLTNLTNQLPAYFLHLPTTFFIVMPLTGAAGGLYFLLTFVAALLRTVLILVAGRLTLPPPKDDQTGSVARQRSPDRRRDVWAAIIEKFPPRIVSIAIYVIPIYIAVFMLNAAGFFDAARQWLTQAVVATFIPMEALSMIVLSFAAEFTSGFAAAGALLETGVLNVKQTVLALLIGNIVAFPIRALRHQLPRYMGIFSPKMGTQLLLIGQGYRVSSLILVGIVYYAVF